MSDAELVELRSKLCGNTFVVEEDPDDPEFFSVFTYTAGGLSGAELAGKIGERTVALALVGALNLLCK